MKKIVINTCFGGFGLSKAAKSKLAELGETRDHDDIPRDDPNLVRVVEELGSSASDNLAKLKIVEIPDDVGDNWYVHDYDGSETIHENHREWS